MNTPLRRSNMARVLKGSHSVTCTPRVHPLTKWTIPAFAFPAEACTHLPTPGDRRLSCPGCVLVLVVFLFYISYATNLALWLQDFNKLTYLLIYLNWHVHCKSIADYHRVIPMKRKEIVVSNSRLDTVGRPPQVCAAP